LGVANCYLLQQESAVLIDAGVPGQGKKFLSYLKIASLSPSDVRLVILTHCHYDHVGSAVQIARLTGAQVAIHQNEAADLAEGKQRPIRPFTRWGRFLMNFTNSSAAKKMQRFDPIKPDFTFSDEPFSLDLYGIAGRVIFTPGHTSGSVSVLLESGEIFIGDAAMNGLPSFALEPSLPIIGEDLRVLKDSWKRILRENVRVVYPGHGKPFQPKWMEQNLH
jgi:glyoxylase-like metal-dependent hydrolase (beta-lactamase superfamily II)